MDQPLETPPTQKQNLLKNSEPPPFSKIVATEVLTVGAALSFGYLFRLYVSGDAFLSALLVAAMLYSIGAALQVFLIPDTRRRMYLIILEVIAFLVFFYDLPINLLLGVAGAMFLLLAWGEVASRQELNNLMTIKFTRVAQLKLSKTTTALVVMTVLLYLPSSQKSNQNLFVSPENFNALFSSSATLLHKTYPEIDFTSSFHSFVQSMVLIQLENLPEYQRLPPAQQQDVTEQKTKQLIDAVGKSANIVVEPSQKSGEVIYNLIVGNLRQWRDKFGGWFDAAWIAFALIFVQSFGVLFYMVAGYLAFLIYELLLAMNVIHLTGEERIHEMIEFS